MTDRYLYLRALRWVALSRVSRISSLYGIGFWVLLLSLGCSLAVWFLWQEVQREILVANHKVAILSAFSKVGDHGDKASEPDRLRAFEDTLLPHSQIPGQIRDILSSAQESGVTIARGSYQQEIDEAGGFSRYRIVWPVKGRAVAASKFINSLLIRQKSLVIESIQFKRDVGDRSIIDVQIQCALLTSLPESEIDSSHNAIRK